ncbi:MAG: S41 family peptidase [Gammaproteobacteria bacterium]|nr:S41 family peptidase [Gammaproteobacteria bacterium]
MTNTISSYYRNFCLIALCSLPLGLQAKNTSNLPLDEIRNFVDVYNVIKNEYVEETDGKTLLDFAIEGMINGLDPHSVYFKKSELENFNESASGSYFGFGIQLEMLDSKLIIVSPIPNSPAEKAGLKPNDRIVKINSTLIENMSMNDVDKLLEEKEKTELTISRGHDTTEVVTLTRSKIEIPSTTAEILDTEYGYIRVTQFQEHTASQFHDLLKEQIAKKVKGIVIDLRNNPGGLVHAATEIANNFLDSGLIVSTKNPNTGTESKIHAEKDKTIAKDIPLVVLINKGSASASELLAGALQSHKRAIVVGQTSFGKGSVQNIIHLSNGDAVKLTTARYYTPNGISIQAQGITPDIELSQLDVEKKDIDLLSYSEANIPGHLTQQKHQKDTDEKNDNPKQASSEAPQKQNTKQSISGTALAKADLQLFEALNVLKVMTLKR